MRHQQNNLKYIRAKNRMEREKGFYTHLGIYLVVNIGITLFKMSGTYGSWYSFKRDLLNFDVLSTCTIWGVILVFHFILFRYGGAWEDRKIEQFMKDELNSKSK